MNRTLEAPANLPATHDPRDLPNYTLPEVAGWLGLPPNTLRVWLVGQNYAVRTETRRVKPVVKPSSRTPLGLSFWNLVECSVISVIRRTHKVSFPKVRRAMDYVSQKLGKKRPLIEAEFSTDGVNLFVEQYGRLVSASQAGQLALRELLQTSLTRIERDEVGLAARLFPWSHRPDEPRVVSVDPRVSFGRPVLIGTGIPVESVLGRFRAGDDLDAIAADFRVEAKRIEDLVRWALGPAAA